MKRDWLHCLIDPHILSSRYVSRVKTRGPTNRFSHTCIYVGSDAALEWSVHGFNPFVRSLRKASPASLGATDFPTYWFGGCGSLLFLLLLIIYTELFKHVFPVFFFCWLQQWDFPSEKVGLFIKRRCLWKCSIYPPKMTIVIRKIMINHSILRVPYLQTNPSSLAMIPESGDHHFRNATSPWSGIKSPIFRQTHSFERSFPADPAKDLADWWPPTEGQSIKIHPLLKFWEKDFSFGYWKFASYHLFLEIWIWLIRLICLPNC